MSKLKVNLLNLKKITIFFSLIAILIGFLNSSLAQTSTTTEKLEKEIASYERLLSSRAQELDDIDETLGSLAATLEVRIRERDSLSYKIAGLREDQKVLQAELESLAEEMQANEQNLDDLNKNLIDLQLRLQDMLVSLHRQRVGTYARVLVESETFFDLRVKSHHLSLLANQDVELIQEIRRTVVSIEAIQKELSLQIAKRNEAIAKIEQTQKDLEVTQEKLTEVILELEANKEGQLAKRKALIIEQEKLEQTVQDAQQDLSNEIARLQREAEEARRRAEEARQEIERQRLKEQAIKAEQKIKVLSVPTQTIETGFYSPVQSAKLVMTYGQEGPYIYLRAPQAGAPVYTAMSGIVTAVAQVSANSGYLVTIQHSTDLVTAYLNLQKPFVKVGDKVSQGQTLAYLGGGTLIPADNLQFRVGLTNSGGRVSWVDPAPKLGVN